MPTGKQIRLEVGRILRDKDAKSFWEFVNSATNTASLTDAINLASAKYSSQMFDDYFVRWSDGSAAAPDGDKVRATSLVGSTGVLSVSPSLSAAAANGETGELWHPEFDPDNIDRSTDRALSQFCTRWRLTPLAWVRDPDFLVDDVGDATPTDWAGTNATATVTTRSGLERFSERVLRVAASGTGAYAAQSLNNPMGSESARTWFFGCLVQADTGTATPILFDVTNTATLTSQSTSRTSWSGEAFNVVSFTAQAADTTEVISVRLGVSDTSGDSYYGPLCVYPVNAKEFVLPTRIVNRSRVGLFYELSGQNWPERNLIPLEQQPILTDIGGGQVRAFFPNEIGARMVFYEEYANYGALRTAYNTVAARRAGDTATTDCPLEYAAWATVRMYLGEGPADEMWQKVHLKHGAKIRPRFVRNMGY